MDKSSRSIVALGSLRKAAAAISLVQASVESIDSYDASRTYTPKEREPYDALSDRFVRAVEVAIRFFRSYERLMYAENSDTYRDLLGRMAKLGIISFASLWVDMREVRNRIVHDYLPEEIKQLYDEISGPYGSELRRLGSQTGALAQRIEATGSSPGTGTEQG
jgi:uncharacterized protein YutE (UPF0331/DUF86 family)